jgi:hypothetical protein
MKERRGRKLAAEYKEASSEIKRTNQELEGVISDGLDEVRRDLFSQFRSNSS